MGLGQNFITNGCSAGRFGPVLWGRGSRGITPKKRLRLRVESWSVPVMRRPSRGGNPCGGRRVRIIGPRQPRTREDQTKNAPRRQGADPKSAQFSFVQSAQFSSDIDTPPVARPNSSMEQPLPVAGAPVSVCSMEMAEIYPMGYIFGREHHSPTETSGPGYPGPTRRDGWHLTVRHRCL